MPGNSPRGAWHGRELPDDLMPPWQWRESGAWLFAVDLWNGGYFWEAWEVWEGLWRQASPVNPLQARFIQGLVMLAGAMVHQERGWGEAEESLFRNGILLIQSVRAETGPSFMGLPLDAFTAFLEASRNTRQPAPILLEPW